MKQSLLILDFVYWYYTRAFRDILTTWSNIMWFIVHYFSIPLLLRTLFSPLKRIHDSYKTGSVEVFFEALVMNTMSRVLGVLVRLCIILIGVAVLLLSVVGFFSLIVMWIAMPLISLVSIVYGVTIFFL